MRPRRPSTRWSAIAGTLRRWGRNYSAWDERTHERAHEWIVTSAGFHGVILAMWWICVLSLPVAIWNVRRDKVNLPLAFAIALAVAAGGTVLYLRKWREDLRERRVRDGHCAACGYDLRASPERCPECGHAASHSGGA